MPPSAPYDPVGTVQQAITALLGANETFFIAAVRRMKRTPPKVAK